MEPIGMDRLLPMTGNLLPGLKEYASPDPRRASRTGRGKKSVSTLEDHMGFRANEMSVAVAAALHLHLRLSFLLPEGRLLGNPVCSSVYQYANN